MAIKNLTDEQVRTWTLEQKDRWWLAEVFRGDMAQLTFRSAATGFLLGGALSATNLYVGAKTGWTLGVGLTSVILAFAAFKVMSKFGVKDMTILENNAMQSIATSAGYMTSPLIAGMAAFMWVENKPLPWWQMFWFNVVLSVLGVLVAFPMKRRFINDEQGAFPEGRACGVVLDTLYSSAAAVGLFKAKALAVAALFAGTITFLSGEAYLKALNALVIMFRTGDTWANVLKTYKDALENTWHLNHNLDDWYYALVKKGSAPLPTIAGIDIRQLALRPTLELAMFGAGGLMGIKAASSMMIGALLNFAVIVPWMISIGEIKPRGIAADGSALFGRVHVLNSWALWWGIVLMVVASMVALFAKPQVFVKAFQGIFGKRGAVTGDVEAQMKKIELPFSWSIIGVPIVGAVGVWMAHEWFGVPWIYGATAIPLIIVLSFIAVSSTSLTGTTPTGSLSKIPQFIYGAKNPTHPATNLMTAVMCTEVAGNASNLLMDIKPGYMLGAKPRQQAIGHCLGIVAGALASTPLFYILFLSNYDATSDAPGTLQRAMAPEGGQFSFPAAVQWKAVSDLVTSVFGGSGGGTVLTPSVKMSMIIAAVAAVVLEVGRILSKGKLPIIPLAVGLGVVVPPDSTFMMFLGALFFWAMHKVYGPKPESTGNKLWVQTHEPICAGIIAGAALIGIGDVLVKVFVLK